MNASGFARRSLIIAAVCASLVGGVVTVRAAAEWTAAAAPLSVAPESVESLQARLAAEEARSAALQAELDGLRGHTTDLSSALDAATTRIAADTSAARALQARLDRAKQRLAALTRLIAATRAAAAATAPAPAAAGSARTTAGEGEREDDGDD